jgi:hypothetical protein
MYRFTDLGAIQGPCQLWNARRPPQAGIDDFLASQRNASSFQGLADLNRKDNPCALCAGTAKVMFGSIRFPIRKFSIHETPL